MDRGKSFRFLGVSETATKAQVKAAYERKAAKYKGADYMEEPAYAERKLAQLYQMYQEAYGLAESGPDEYMSSRFERDDGQPSKKKTAKASRLLEEERDAADHNAREKFHQWMERRDEAKHRSKSGKGVSIPKLNKPDFSKLKDRLNEIKDEVASQLELGFGEETPTEEYRSVEGLEAATDDFEDFAKKCIYTNEDENLKRNEFSGEILTESGNVEPAKSEMNGEALGTVISIIVALIIFLVGACEDDSISTEYEYEEPGYSYIYDQTYEDANETDWELAELADESYMLLCEQDEHGSATLQDNVQSEYEEKAVEFAKNYWDKNSIDEVSDYLYDTYGDYMTSSDDPLSIQLEAIFAFYGFASLDTASWYEQPYTGDRIESYGDYLDYLNQFYDEQDEE